MLAEHTHKQFDADLEAVRARVLEMGGLVEDQVNKAVEALVTQNAQLAEEVIANDSLVNSLEITSDEACTQIIALRQPAASDLRMIMPII
ncbi:MAG: PhoU domain-containing protein, partial [Gallionellaceae bacterium]|nr:PhoU domain-containing protein [Gallionellaceae bacterium]